MMLKFTFDMDDVASRIEDAVKQVLKEGYRTVDIMSEGMKQVSTGEMGSLIADRV